VSDNCGGENEVINGVFLEGGGSADPSKRVKRADGFPPGQPVRLARSVSSRLLSDTNAEDRPRTDTSWYDERHADALGHEAAQTSSGRLYYISGLLLHQLAMTAENRALPDDVFHGITEATQVIASIIYVGHHWTTTWWCTGSNDRFFAEGLQYKVQPAQYKFRDCIKSRFAVELNDVPNRLYIGTQHYLKYDGTLNQLTAALLLYVSFTVYPSHIISEIYACHRMYEPCSRSWFRRE
jgi:hypothetical protein